METVSENRCFGGVQGVYRHASAETGTDMQFAVFVPPGGGPRPVLWYLSGLTCTEENFTVKAGAQRYAAEHGIVLVAPDTSPRGAGIAGEDDAYDFGTGAGFYVDATESPWSANYRMYSYVTRELPALVAEHFPVDAGRQGITGHSMGGHGALTIAMNMPDRFASVSAFSPIVNPTQSSWGRKQFGAYLGSDESQWAKHDATLLMNEKGFDGPILCDTGTSDQFLDLLMPESFAKACATRRQQSILRMQPGYDHSYFFVSSFMEEHVAFHAEALYAG